MSLPLAILVLLFTVLACGAIARRSAMPLPLLLIPAGTLLALVPGMHAVAPDPETFFLVFVPPLLFADAWLIPKREFLSLRYPILGLALGLVLCTVLATGYLVHWLIPSVPLAAGFALGAVISPTDAVAVSSITERLRLPARLTHILNGESLINDASGLVAFRFSVAAALTGSFSAGEAAANFVLVAVGGVLAGLGATWLLGRLRIGLSHRGWADESISTGLTLLAPYAAYLAAESLHLSGVLGAVAGGWFAAMQEARDTRPSERLVMLNVWQLLLYFFNGLVFVLLGLRLPEVIDGVAGQPWMLLVGGALAITALAMLLRLVWVFPASRAMLWLTRRHAPQTPVPPWRQVLVAGWAAPRGAITLAAALSLPVGGGFPERELLVFYASAVIVLTLLVNALTLPPLIRRLGLRADDHQLREMRSAHVALAQAAIRRLRAALDLQHAEHEMRYTQRLIGDYERRIGRHCGRSAEEAMRIAPEFETEISLRRLGIAAERRELRRLRREALISDEVIRDLLHDLDLREVGLDSVARQPSAASARAAEA